MQQLKKIIAGIFIIVVLHLLKKTLSGESLTYTFYYNLFSCCEVFVLLWFCVTLLLEEMLLKRILKKRVALAGLGCFLVFLCSLEAGCTYLLNHPKKIPAIFFSAFKAYYDDFDCRIIQYLPAFTRYDRTFFYELKNNQRFVFSNREFSDSFFTNSKGLRDDEVSLSQPDIICIGDSYMLGWGCRQDSNIPSMIEKKTGLKVLKVSMSSYGTARELKKLQGVDMSHVRCVFWQYCYNDEEENKSFISNGYSLPILPPKTFDSVVLLHKWTRKYFPGRHFLTMSKLALRGLLFNEQQSAPKQLIYSDSSEKEQEAGNFLRIMQRSPIDFSKTRLIVFELGPYPVNDGFINKVRQLSNQDQFREKFKGNISSLYSSAFLNRNDYY